MDTAIINMWQEGKWSLADVGKKHGLSRQRIHQILVANNIERKSEKRSLRSEYERKMYGEAVTIVKERYLKGEKLLTVARDVGVPMGIVNKLFVRTDKDKETHRRNTFFKWTERNGECLEWTGSYSSQGTPRFPVNINNNSARRWAWYFAYGEFPDKRVRITCKNSKCVEVGHLK